MVEHWDVIQGEATEGQSKGKRRCPVRHFLFMSRRKELMNYDHIHQEVVLEVLKRPLSIEMW